MLRTPSLTLLACATILLLPACSDDGGGTGASQGGSSSDGTSAGSTTAPGTDSDATTNPSTTSPTTDPTTTNSTTTDPTGASTGPAPFCGDGAVDAGEECDDGNDVDTDFCLNTCKKAVCGDSVVQAVVEECDDGNMDNTDACVDGCKNATCGDGFVGPGEGCDDGNMVDNDGCSNTCASASCGDGKVDAGEECDDGNMVDTDACLTTCKNAVCGDGKVQAGKETCDDGNMVDTDACVGMCVAAKCGDGFVQAGVEECDDANMVDNDVCSNACKMASCADKVKNGAETDVDCGGNTCAPCEIAKVCKVNADCQSDTCTNGKCASGLMLPACQDNMAVTATNVFMSVVSVKCAPCHTGVGQSGGLNMKDAATLKANTVGVASTNAAIPRVTASNLDNSFLIYKILGQQLKAPGGGGSSMPLGGSLTMAEQCTVINWVKFGAK